MNSLATVRIEKPIRSNSFPFPSLCENFEEYFVKFPIKGVDTIDLTYELVCKYLGDHFGIPIPDVAIARANHGSWNSENIPELEDGMLGFASKKVENSDILSRETALIKTKHDFNRLDNPLDLLRIGVFDLHIRNMDRSEENFNLILEYQGKDKIIAIDHVAAFGGVHGKNRFQPRTEPDVGKNVMRSEFGRTLLKYIEKEERKHILEQYQLQMHNLKEVLDVAFQEVPKEWGLTDSFQHRITDFLTNEQRNQSIIEQFKRLFGIL